MSNKKRIPYSEGTWFAVPLDDNAYCVGRVARCMRGGGVVLAYFFGPRRDRVATLEEVRSLQADDAIKALRVGDPGLMKGEWPIIGDSDCWNRQVWPMPDFLRKDAITGKAWRIKYSDRDPNQVVSEERAPFESRELEADMLYGYGVVEELLSHALPT